MLEMFLTFKQENFACKMLKNHRIQAILYANAEYCRVNETLKENRHFREGEDFFVAS